MRPLSAIFALVARAALAASTSLASPTNYHFSVPFGRISGVVMGDGGDYSAMRSEDLCWLQEALAERYALSHYASYDHSTSNSYTGTRQEHGVWGLDQTNGCLSWVTAITNAHVRDQAGRETRVPHTNIVLRTFASTNWWHANFGPGRTIDPTIGSPQIESDVTVGTEFLAGCYVATNLSLVSAPCAMPETWTHGVYVDAVAADGEMRYETFSNTVLRGWYRKSQIASAFSDMRRCTRLVADGTSVTNFRSIHTDKRYQKNYDLEDGLPELGVSYESSPDTTYESVDANYSVVAHRENVRYAAIEDDEEKDVAIGAAHSYLLKVPEHDLFVDTGVRASTESVGGISRIDQANSKFFCVFTVRGQAELTDEEGDVVRTGVVDDRTVVIPVSATAVQGPLNDVADGQTNLFFRVESDWSSWASTIAGLLGIQIPTSYDDLPDPGSPSAPDVPPGQVAAPHVVMTSRSVELEYEISQPTIVGILKVTPATRLQGWE